MWTEPDIKGSGTWFDNVAYDANYYSTTSDMTYNSVGISYRGLNDIEQLDFSVSDGTSLCGKYLYSAGKVAGPEYWNTIPISCFRLWVNRPYLAGLGR